VVVVASIKYNDRGCKHDGGRLSHQSNRTLTNHVDDEDNFMFDIYRNMFDTVNFVIAQ